MREGAAQNGCWPEADRQDGDPLACMDVLLGFVPVPSPFGAGIRRPKSLLRFCHGVLAEIHFVMRPDAIQ
jgi:hypothetical protein